MVDGATMFGWFGALFSGLFAIGVGFDVVVGLLKMAIHS